MTLPESILIIDDEAGMTEVIGRALRNWFPRARIASENDIPVVMPPVDVVLLDLFLKASDAATLAILAANRDVWPPVVCMTGKIDVDDALEMCMRAGAHDFISKERARDTQVLAEKLHLAFLRHKYAAHQIP